MHTRNNILRYVLKLGVTVLVYTELTSYWLTCKSATNEQGCLPRYDNNKATQTNA